MRAPRTRARSSTAFSLPTDMPCAGWSSSAPPRCARSPNDPPLRSPRHEPDVADALAVLVARGLRTGPRCGAPATDAIAVRVAPVSVDRVAPPVTATGTLGPKEEVTLSFTVGGVVSRIFVDEGRSVRAG